MRTSSSSPRLARLVSWGHSPAQVPNASHAIDQALDQLEAGQADVLMAPGGFLEAPWPKGFEFRSGWDSRAADLPPLVASAEKTLDRLLTKSVRSDLARRVRYFTLGVDLYASEDRSGDLHAELVAVVDLHSDRPVHWTGKSYPTHEQEETLVQVVDLCTHLYESELGHTLVLGCHDLNLFGERGRATQTADGPRRTRCDEMRKLATAFAPTMVLHHPHWVDSARIWSTAWAGVRKNLPTVQTWASAIRYDNPGDAPRGDIDAVLASTRSDVVESLDLVTHVPPEGLRLARQADLTAGSHVHFAVGSLLIPCVIAKTPDEDDPAVDVLPNGRKKDRTTVERLMVVVSEDE